MEDNRPLPSWSTNPTLEVGHSSPTVTISSSGMSLSEAADSRANQRLLFLPSPVWGEEVFSSLFQADPSSVLLALEGGISS